MMALTWDAIRKNAIKFSARWEGAAREEAERQVFLISFLSVFGVNFDQIKDSGEAFFEYRVPQEEGHKGYIDFLWKGRLLVEMKSRGKSLDDAMKQAYRYLIALPSGDMPPLVMVSDFENIWVNVREAQKTYKLKTKELYKKVRYFADIAGYSTVKPEAGEDNIAVNVSAALKLSKLHDICKEYGYDLHSLEIYLVRILFCLFAENTGIFEKSAFKDYIEASRQDAADLPTKIQHIFEILNMPEATRETKKYLTPDLLQFRYVNGGLFRERLEMPPFDVKMREILLECTNFDWSKISPAIFGAMFQGVMNEKLRRMMGAHYTSEENILKVIKPLFLDDLWNEFEKVKFDRRRLTQFHNKIASLKFLDPACGCGNFLILAYRELRKLEYAVLNMLIENKQKVLDVATLLKVSINQFYGIELEEFPCRIAQVGMWLMEHQMNLQAADQLGTYYIDLPLKTSATIVNADALTTDWESVVSKDELSYIMGNPPFNGARTMTQEQKAGMVSVFGADYRNVGNLDFVCAWYRKAADMMKDTTIRASFVSTNSISQGEQPAILWKPLIEQEGFKIDFAYRTFKWTNEGRGMAAVHCVIVGFSSKKVKRDKKLFDETGQARAQNINGYLYDAPNVYVESRTTPLCKVPAIGIGNQPIDGGYYLFTEEEKEAFVAKEPQAEKWFRIWLGSDEFINNWRRWCLRLKECPPNELKQMPECIKRINAVREYRSKSKRASTLKLANTPLSFQVENIPETDYLLIPSVSSERREYIPIGFMPKEILSSNLVLIVPNATLYHFGVLSSSAHMAWVRAVCGRLEMRYRYSKDIVYNNFPWPKPDAEQKAEIETAARAVLEAREQYKNCSLADLYDPNTMPDLLRKAHGKLDKAVAKAYAKNWKTEAECVADLLTMYQALVKKKNMPQKGMQRKKV